MISENTVHRCTRYQSTNIFKNGHNKSGNPQFRCKDCGRSSVIKPKIKYTDEQKELIIRTALLHKPTIEYFFSNIISE